MDLTSLLPLLLGGGDNKEFLLNLLKQKMGDSDGLGVLSGLFGGGNKQEAPKTEPAKENTASADFPFEKTDIKEPELKEKPAHVPMKRSIFDLLPRLLSIKR